MYSVLLSDSRSLNGNLMTLTDNAETKDAEYAVHMIEPPIKEIKMSPLKGQKVMNVNFFFQTN